MSVRPARDAFLECDGCHKEIKPGATAYSGLLMTFRSVDKVDLEPTFQGPQERRHYHIWCVDPKAVEPEGYEDQDQ